ncbi:MAG: HAD family hydrolase [Phycisphaeraceae bacterium]|nr:HAD family hydrolase [Phycisphaeraceae bacterium]
MNYRAVIFDLDGTLADTLADIAAAANNMRASFGRPAMAVDDYRLIVGQGVHYLVEHALGDSPDVDSIERGAEMIRNWYLRGHVLTKPYPGIPDMLDALTRRKLKLAVLTNKPDEPAAVLLAEKFARWRFDVLRGAREGEPIKPDPSCVQKVLAELNVPAAECLYVGDTAVDMQTGKGAKLFTVGVTWGFRQERELRDNHADAIIHQPMQLLELIDA